MTAGLRQLRWDHLNMRKLEANMFWMMISNDGWKESSLSKYCMIKLKYHTFINQMMSMSLTDIYPPVIKHSTGTYINKYSLYLLMMFLLNSPISSGFRSLPLMTSRCSGTEIGKRRIPSWRRPGSRSCQSRPRSWGNRCSSGCFPRWQGESYSGWWWFQPEGR